MRLHNAGFIAVCLLGLAALVAQLTAVNFRHRAGLRPAVSDTDSQRRCVELVDGEFAADWQAQSLAPARSADTWTVARRLSLALTGTIPSLEEIRLLQALPDEERVARWIDHLLSDRRSSDYLAERLARIYVGIEEGPFLVYRRRRFVTWLSDQLFENRPYDELVRELISGRGIWTDSPAVNFVTVTNDVNGDEQPDEERLAARTARAFLGVPLDCVQCHDDHLTGRWLQRDFQQLAAYFAEANSSLLGIQDKPREYEFQYLGSTAAETVPPQVPFAPALCLDDGPRRERLANWVTHPENRAFHRTTVNRVWALMFGKPLVEPIDDLSLEGPYPPGLETLAADFAAHGCDLRRLMRIVARTRVFGIDSRHVAGVTESHEDHWATFPVTRLRPEQVAGALLQASALVTIDANSHLLMRLARFDQQKAFVRRFGDTGEDEFTNRGGTIPQRLLLMNGELMRERTKEDLVANAVTRMAKLVSDDRRAVESAYWATLTRLPSEREREHFVARLKGQDADERRAALEDLYWAAFNSTEFSWNH